MNALVEMVDRGALALRDEELCSVLQSSLYPGAKMESIKLVIAYCRAAGLDPMQKPVHIVPMSVKVPGKNGGKDDYQMRDVVMPGVGLYRIQAARSGAYAGISEPQFGPSKTLRIPVGEHGQETLEFDYPEWCSVTVRRIVQGTAVEFTATEYWLENYATKSRESKVPNAMWQKRPRGQIAKCAQAQALRMGFPEMTGAAPTADEMEGKSFEVYEASPPQTVEMPRAKAKQEQEPKPADPPADASPSSSEPSAPAADDGEVTPQNAMTPGQVSMVQAKMKRAALTEMDFEAKWGKSLLDGSDFPRFKKSEVNDILAWIDSKAG